MLDEVPCEAQCEAYDRAAPYWDADPFDAPGFDYEVFALDPEAVTDSAFEAWGDLVIATEEVDAIVADKAAIADAVEDDEGRYEQIYNALVARCPRIPTAKARALCYAGAMGIYAGCLAGRILLE